MKLILDTLERARLAASPSDAIALADAIADLGDLADVLAARGWTLDEAPATLDAFAAVVNHVAAQPFDVLEGPGRDGETLQIVEDAAPGAFADWLATLERLAG
jgi:hypothetical protein